MPDKAGEPRVVQTQRVLHILRVIGQPSGDHKSGAEAAFVDRMHPKRNDSQETVSHQQTSTGALDCANMVGQYALQMRQKRCQMHACVFDPA